MIDKCVQLHAGDTVLCLEVHRKIIFLTGNRRGRGRARSTAAPMASASSGSDKNSRSCWRAQDACSGNVDMEGLILLDIHGHLRQSLFGYERVMMCVCLCKTRLSFVKHSSSDHLDD